MILGNQVRYVLNDQKIPSPDNEPQRFPGFAQKQPPELFLKVLQISQESNCVAVSFGPATLL